MDNWDNYLISGTDVLKNKLNINNKSELEAKEKEIVLNKLIELELNPIDGNFDKDHLFKIHKYLFEDIYPFAGEYRKCTMAKTTRNFYDPEIIDDELNKELATLNNNFKNVNDLRYYSFLLSNAYYNIMTIHPFREGNGRSVREFLREFVEAKNIELPFDVELDFSKMDKKNFLQGVEYRYLYPSLLEMEFYNALSYKEKTNKKQ